MNVPMVTHRWVFGFACLGLFFAAVVAHPAHLQGGVSFFIKLGAGTGGQTQSLSSDWTYNLYAENGTVSGAYTIDTKGLVLEPGLGVFFSPHIGLEILFVPASGSGSASFSATVPHPFYFNQFRTASWEATDLPPSANELTLNLLGRLALMEGRLGLLISAGLSYFPSVKVNALSDFTVHEAGYPYTQVSATPTYAEFSQAAVGYSLGCGAEYSLVKGLGAYVSGRYVIASADIDIGHGGRMAVKPGGLRLVGGLKYSFAI